MQLNGKARTYVLFVPNGYDATKSIPLIFAWHSSGASGAESRKYYKLEPVTGDGAIIVYPDGLNGGWDLSADGVDMKFFDALLESISKDYCVDQARVFSTGYSFGGMMSHSLACDRGSKLRAFAPMAGAFFDGAKSCPTPVPAWIAHASNDPTVSYASGQAARDIWLKTNGCATATMPTTPSPCVAYQCTKAPVEWCVHTAATSGPASHRRVSGRSSRVCRPWRRSPSSGRGGGSVGDDLRQVADDCVQRRPVLTPFGDDEIREPL